MSAERFRWQDVPEPPELIAQTEAAKKDRAHNETRCADCDRPRWAHGLTSYVRMGDGSLEWVGCRFVEPCPNANDPVLCAYDNAWRRFIPEASCPVHDPDRSNR